MLGCRLVLCHLDMGFNSNIYVSLCYLFCTCFGYGEFFDYCYVNNGIDQFCSFRNCYFPAYYLFEYIIISTRKWFVKTEIYHEI
jgi:hypothetical protein